jgi:hypothetical protein
MRRPGLLPGLIFLLLIVHASALEIRETLWGFDGRVVPGRMNVISVRVANPGGGTFEGELNLRESGGVGAAGGAPYVQPVYLAPQSERWVQFTIFIGTGYEDFVVSWGRGSRDSYSLIHPALGPPARVILIDAQNPFAGSSRLRALPDTLFPTTAAATDGLDGVVLDYVPRWEPVRREAFMDWLRRGGKVIVLAGTNGAWPTFTEQLAPLNIEGETARIGAGTVVRATGSRREASEKIFVERGFSAPEIKQNSSVAVFSLEQTLFQQLARLTRPKIRWWLINVLTLLYIAVVGPVHYRWGRRIDYRVSLGAFVGCIALFGFLFSVVGRRGYDEAQTVHSLSLARAVGPGRYDVTQWISAFATRGDIYPLTHTAPANLYATVSTEPINGKLLNGRDGHFIADIPLFSSRQFLHRAVMPGDDISVTVEQWEEDGAKLKTLVLRVGPAFPRAIVEARVRFRDQYYELHRDGDRLALSVAGQKQDFADFIPRDKVQMAMGSMPDFEIGEPAAPAADAALLKALPLLYVQAADGQEYFQHPIDHGSQPPDRLELYVFTKSPSSFALQAEGFGHETGYTLYVQEIPKP